MSNPFSGLNLQLPKRKKQSPRLPEFDVKEMLTRGQSSTPKDARDRVILLLRHRYHLRPSEISALNINNIDLSAGVIEIPGQRKNPHIFLCEEDLMYFRRWLTVRKLFAANNPAFIISLHWTSGRSNPYQRISTRGIFQVANYYLEGNHK